MSAHSHWNRDGYNSEMVAWNAVSRLLIAEVTEADVESGAFAAKFDAPRQRLVELSSDAVKKEIEELNDEGITQTASLKNEVESSDYMQDVDASYTLLLRLCSHDNEAIGQAKLKAVNETYDAIQEEVENLIEPSSAPAFR